MILNKEVYKDYIDRFNMNDEETVIQHIDNNSAWIWLNSNIPFFDCPDKTIEEIYYFRWWVYRKHIKSTPDGFVITEFHPLVNWAGKHNTINSASGHHLYEGRWLKNSREYLDDYILFWFRKGGNLRSYSTWLVDAIWNYCCVIGKFDIATNLLPDFVENYCAWETSNLHSSGLFRSTDDRDAMELSISGSGLRPTLNSYMYADAFAIAKVAEHIRNKDIDDIFSLKARKLKGLMQDKLWDKVNQFFKVIPISGKDDELYSLDFKNIDVCNVREQIGYIPWYFNIPNPGYENAWKQLMDEEGFFAPFGPTTAEQRHERFMFSNDHECLWNGPSWPFATSQTLTAMANLLRNYNQSIVNRTDYYQLLRSYAQSHYLKKEDNIIVPWLDENIDPYTGEWLARSILKKWNWREDKGGYERGKDYNHSTYCDLIISGLIGLIPGDDESLEINPLIPAHTWQYFCLEDVLYHGKQISIMYDETGERYGKGKGLKVFVDDKEIAGSDIMERISVKLSN